MKIWKELKKQERNSDNATGKRKKKTERKVVEWGISKIVRDKGFEI